MDHVPFEGGRIYGRLAGGHVDCSSQTSALKPFVMAVELGYSHLRGKAEPSFPDVPPN